MPVTDSFARLPLACIKVIRDERQRRKIETEDLERSIAKIGVLKPIIVAALPESELPFVVQLVAGERRLTACINLGLPDIIVRFADQLSPIELQIIELEENLKREDLSWTDLVLAIARIHALHLALDPDWTQGETADSVSMTAGTISMYLRVAGELGSNERVRDAGTVREAYNIILRKDSRAEEDAMSVLLGTPAGLDDDDLPEPGLPPGVLLQDMSPYPASIMDVLGEKSIKPGEGQLRPLPDVAAPRPAPDPIQCKSFLDWVTAPPKRKFNFVHCDFPYGVDLFSGPQARGAEPGRGEGEAVGYSDSPDVYFALLESFCKNLDGFMTVSAHLMFWYSEKHGDATRKMFSQLAPSLVFQPFPLIWVKSDNAGIASDPRHGPRHVYETCMLASRGQRQIARVMADAYSSPSDRKLHPSTKPEPMLRHFMTMLVDGSSEVFDPTCGSGAAIRAADSLGAKRVLGLEIDKEYHAGASRALRNARALRVGAGL